MRMDCSHGQYLPCYRKIALTFCITPQRLYVLIDHAQSSAFQGRSIIRCKVCESRGYESPHYLRTLPRWRWRFKRRTRFFQCLPKLPFFCQLLDVAGLTYELSANKDLRHSQRPGDLLKLLLHRAIRWLPHLVQLVHNHLYIYFLQSVQSGCAMGSVSFAVDHYALRLHRVGHHFHRVSVRFGIQLRRFLTVYSCGIIAAWSDSFEFWHATILGEVCRQIWPHGTMHHRGDVQRSHDVSKNETRSADEEGTTAGEYRLRLEGVRRNFVVPVFEICHREPLKL
eukprot:gnl/TRDRNA2_/TRDRNA2_125245_c0_seq2.p1 gnl/TRDRNA2_/TRDRNA2_125245_c0~~gnl/TRDRNA2_/TRDRNA2_125245_c0_seq2.p1  ORF type:complete len:282 (-),score=-12.90 gnl/TRDRNA2_/TRDRNA2_125245_c0_seq2:40-885(-)